MVPPQRVTSAKNPLFRRFRDAVDSHENEIALEGPKAILDAIELGWKPLALATNGKASLKNTEGAKELVLDAKLFRQISETVTSQGVIGLFARPQVVLERLFRGGGVIVVLDGIQDPGNVGTMIRLAAAFEAAGVAVLEGTADPFGVKAIRASAGAVLMIPVVQTTREILVESIHSHGFELWAADAGGASGPRLPSRKLALAFGSEGRGVSKELRKAARNVSIPMSRHVDSLNVAAAAAILLARLYEARAGGTVSA